MSGLRVGHDDAYFILPHSVAYSPPEVRRREYFSALHTRLHHGNSYCLPGEPIISYRVTSQLSEYAPVDNSRVLNRYMNHQDPDAIASASDAYANVTARTLSAVQGPDEYYAYGGITPPRPNRTKRILPGVNRRPSSPLFTPIIPIIQAPTCITIHPGSQGASRGGLEGASHIHDLIGEGEPAFVSRSAAPRGLEASSERLFVQVIISP
ncbi:hypothetical protein CIB48_g2271 [Xylaria polymorpha]|nr:hypothetical protein CIB48_g2271 [Xylaria polymorpha]